MILEGTMRMDGEQRKHLMGTVGERESMVLSIVNRIVLLISVDI